MASINKVTLIGNLGHDPQISYTSEGVAIANLSIATTKSWTDRQTGERKEHVEWHRVVLYRRLAEVAGEYLRKGSSVYIEGELRTRKLMGDDGIDRYSTEVIGNVMQMLGGKAQNGSGQQQTANKQNRPAKQSTQAEQPSSAQSMMDMDDVPF